MSKRIIIVGAGVVGLNSARRLSDDGHDVVLIDRDESMLRHVQDQLDVKVVAGNGASIDTLREASIEKAELLLAVTNSDEVNMITALTAGNMFQVPKKLVRLRSREYMENIEELAKNWPGETYGISPDLVATRRIATLLDVPHAIDVAELIEGKIVVAGFTVLPNCPLLGRSIAEMRSAFPDEKFLMAAVYRHGKALLPKGSTELLIGDRAYFSCPPDRVPRMVELMGYKYEREPRVVIGGGGYIAQMLAEITLERGLSTVIIHDDPDEASSLAVRFPKALVLAGGLTDETILREAGITSTTAFVAATDDQETNLLSSVLAKQRGASRVITLVDSSVYMNVAATMNIDAIVSPRLASVSEILRYVRGSQFSEIANLLEEKIEIDVVEVTDNSPLSGRPIKDIGLPGGTLITAVATADEVLVPRGTDIIPVGARAVLFVLAEVADELEAWLEKGR